MKRIAGLFLLLLVVSSGVASAEVIGLTDIADHSAADSQENRRRGRGRGSDDSRSNRNSNSNDTNSRNSNGNKTDAARRSALDAVPGRIINEEYEYKNGREIHEFYIRDSDARVFEVYVDAENAKVIKIERRSRD